MYSFQFNNNSLAELLDVAVADIISVEQAQGLQIEYYKNVGKAKTPLTKVDINGFFKLVRNALIDAQDKDNLPEKYRIWFGHEYPDFGNVEDYDGVNTADKVLNGIIYKIGGRSPAPQAGPINGESKIQYKPVPIEIVKYNQDYDLEISGQFMRTVVEFDIFSTKSIIADDRALWFENFIDDYLWYFSMHGVEVFYKARLADRNDTIKKQTYKLRPLQYWVRTQRIRHKLLKKLESIDIRYDIGTSVERLQLGRKIYETMV